MTGYRIVTVGLMAALMSMFPLARSDGQTHAPLSDAQIQAMVDHELSKENELRTVTVTVEKQIVTLAGTVPSLWAKDKAIEEAVEVEDVQLVVNELTIMTAESDAEIGNEAVRRVLRYQYYTIFDNLNVGVDEGVVQLTGQVTEPYKRNEIARLVSRVRGVQEIDNQIEVLPTSGFDDQLRASISTRIYRNSVFERYGLQVNPPIHVVVTNSRVTLTGIVSSNLERQLAESIVRQTFGVLGVVNELKIKGREHH